MPFKVNAAQRHHIPKQRHRVTNPAACDATLRQRGSLTAWFTDAAIAAWKAEPGTTATPPAPANGRRRSWCARFSCRPRVRRAVGDESQLAQGLGVVLAQTWAAQRTSPGLSDSIGVMPGMRTSVPSGKVVGKIMPLAW